jgi:hypothetical protein
MEINSDTPLNNNGELKKSRDQLLYDKIEFIRICLSFLARRDGDVFSINERVINGSLFFVVKNESREIMGIVGRGSDFKSVIRYTAPDRGRIRWLEKEGFELTHEVFSKNPITLNFKSVYSFILFIRGEKGWSANYLENE